MKIVEFKDYDNQTTPLSAYNLNRLQQNLITTKYQMTFSSAVSGGSTITLPCYYQVGQDTLDVYLNSELLKKASTKDSEGHYYEVGNSDTKSNQIKITSDWSIASGDVLNLIVRGTTDSYDQNLSPDKATQLADEISANKEEITALQTENSRLKGITNAMPKVTGEDTSLTLSNTANSPFNNITLKGNTEQTQYSGKNLFQTLNYSNSNWLGYSINADTKYIIISGSNTRGALLIEAQNKIYTLKANTTYTLTLFYISGDITSGDLYLIIQDWKNSDYPKFYTPSITSKNKKNVSITFTTDSTERTYNNCGVYFNNLTCSNLVVACQLEINSTATSYEQYVGGMPSPNPDYPQEIKVVTGDNTIKISNKNLLNGTHQTTITANGITITSNSDDTFDITGISTSETSFGLITNIDQSNLVVGKTYYFYMSEKYNIQNLNVSIITHTPSLHYWMANTAHTIEENQKYNSIILYVPKGVTMNYHNIKFMINEGSTAIDYVPNKQQVFPISLGSLELCKIGDYQDYFYKSGSKWYLHKEINKITSYNGETITTSYISTTGELSTGAKVYYVVNSTDTEITDTTLISQLNALYNAYTYNDTTNISQTNANLPFIINAEALKQEKLIAGTGIEITGENIINNLNANYSTEETKIGTWIDGKPLYRKTFNITSGLSPSLNMPHNISNIDYCKCYGTLITGISTIEQFYASSTDYFRCFRDGDVVKIRYGTSNNPTTIIINLEYTKTTD